MALERLYLSQATLALDSWLAGPKLAPTFTGFALTLKAEDQPSVDAAHAFRERCFANGLECLIGFRTAETFTHQAHWCEKRYWEESAATMRRLIAGGIDDLHLDNEAYGLAGKPGKMPDKASLAMIGRTPAQLRAAMEPFLASIEPLRQVRIYPAAPEDESIAALYDRVLFNADKIELWCERFDYAKQVMRDPHGADHMALDMARRRARLERKFPEASLIREGDYDWFPRAVGNEVRRNRMDDYGAHEPWVFLLHQHSDEGQIGSLEWYESAKLGAGNRVSHAWALASCTDDFRQVGMSSVLLKVARGTTAPELPMSTIISTLGYRLSDKRYVWGPKVLPEGSSVVWTTVFDGEVPYSPPIPTSGDALANEKLWLPVMGESQPNQDSWAIVASENMLYLRLAAAAPGGAREYIPCGKFVRGRFAVARNPDRSYRVVTSDGQTVVVPSRPVRLGAGSLYFGAASTPGGSNTTAPLTTEALVLGRAEVHARDVASDELAAIVAGPYPRD